MDVVTQALSTQFGQELSALHEIAENSGAQSPKKEVLCGLRCH